MKNTTINGLLDFLTASPSPYHATKNLCDLFRAAGFQRLDETDEWQLQTGKKYYYTRADASIIAFRLGENISDNGIRLVGAHTDSPCLKVKPTPEINTKGYARLRVEVYGGALLNPWFDRDLSLAGRVTGTNKSGHLISALVNFNKAIAYIPSLAIHLNREANDNKTVNPQLELNAILDVAHEEFNFRELLLTLVNEENPEAEFKEILDFNISFYDVQPPSVVGLNDAFIASARLDNLLSCYLAAESLLKSETQQTAAIVFNDHEEVGSRSEAGAQGTMLNDFFARLLPDVDSRQRALRRSFMFSIDNAHGVHPNYADKHDGSHGPILNDGPVIKYNSDQSYATTSDGAGFVRWLANQGDSIPIQSFVMRADMRCGSTIGPITATNSGIKTVDIGNAQFAMHSLRELAGVKDAEYMRNLIDRFLLTERIPF